MYQNPEASALVLPRLLEGLAAYRYDELCPDMAFAEFEEMRQFLEQASVAVTSNLDAELPAVAASDVSFEQQPSSLADGAMDESVLEAPDVLVCCKCEMSHLNAEFQANKISMATMLARMQELDASTLGDQRKSSSTPDPHPCFSTWTCSLPDPRLGTHSRLCCLACQTHQESELFTTVSRVAMQMLPCACCAAWLFAQS